MLIQVSLVKKNNRTLLFYSLAEPQTFSALNLKSAFCSRFVHAAEPLHIRVQRPERLQTEA